ncbi:MAG: hypothetical protein Q9161_007347 [Pseudevernia consocians]
MCLSELVGGVEVEERRPRTSNEPRHKRLNFVRGHRRDSDEWVTRPHTGRLTQQERWDRQREQQLAQQRPLHPIPHPQFQEFHDPRMMQLPPGHQGHQAGFDPRTIQLPPGHQGHQAGFDPRGHHGHHEPPQLDRRSHHSDESFYAFEDLGHNGHDGHDGQGHLEPRIIQRRPPKSRLPKGLKANAGGHKKKFSISSSSSDDSSSSDSSSGFAEGFRAGRRSLSKRPAPRGRSRSRLTDDSFEDLMQPRLRSRSRRGRW